MNNEFRIKNMIADSMLYQLEQQTKETLKIYYANLEQENKELKEKIDKAIKYIDIETNGCDEEPIEGSWLYDLYAIRDILGAKGNE